MGFGYHPLKSPVYFHNVLYILTLHIKCYCMTSILKQANLVWQMTDWKQVSIKTVEWHLTT